MVVEGLGCGTPVLLKSGDIEFSKDGPKEADHLTGDGGGGDLPGLLGCQTVKEGVEAVLTLPGMADDVRVLPLLAFA